MLANPDSIVFQKMTLTNDSQLLIPLCFTENDHNHQFGVNKMISLYCCVCFGWGMLLHANFSDFNPLSKTERFVKTPKYSKFTVTCWLCREICFRYNTAIK